LGKGDDFNCSILYGYESTTRDLRWVTMDSLLIVVVLFVILGFGLALVRTRSSTNRHVLDERDTPQVSAPDVDGTATQRVDEAEIQGPAVPDGAKDVSAPAKDTSPDPASVLQPGAPRDLTTEVEQREHELEESSPAELAPAPHASMASSLSRSRGPFASLFSRLRSGGAGVDAEEWTRLEETLILSDMGPTVASEVVAALKSQLGKSPSAHDLRQALVALLESKFADAPRELQFSEITKPSVVLMVGVNGTGKTTTIGKVASLLMREGRSVMIAAGDTFRAAATEQVGVWASLTGVEVVSGQPGADPASVIFDTIEHARAVGSDVVLCDTAGRLQTKTNLMEELKKIRRVAAKSSGEVTEVLLVIDATTGQNGLRQAEVFHGAAEVTGIVLTKLDGSAKGGVALAIESEFGLPIKLVGLGEGLGDLAPFDPKAFVQALIGEETDV
jgi:fused signal recognition particle receptor